jgi:peptidoglycan/xylan/chitin deacetylase (PgdA/CDA1 family)
VIRTAGTTAAVLGAAVGAAQALPAITSIAPLRRAAWPRLAGAGSPATVALTFDDGPDGASTPNFLSLLDTLSVPATFFVLGEMARRAPSLLTEISAAGHEVAVHGWTHRNHLKLTPWLVRDELARTFDLIAGLTGRAPVWFRPPYGVLTSGGVWAARSLRLRPLLWTAWGRDWEASATPESVLATLARGLAPGATLLLHDSDCTSAPGAWRSALGAVPEIVTALRDAGAEFVTASRHLR